MLGLASVLTACDAGDTARGAAAQAEQAPPAPQDATISTTDTRVTATLELSQTATIQSSTPIYHPATGTSSSTLTLPAQTRRYAVEAGYTSAGAATFNLYALDPMGDPQAQAVDVARTVSIRNGALELKDAQGQFLHGTDTGGTPARTILNYTGDQALTFIDGVKTSSLPSAGTTESVIDGSVTVTQVSQSGTRWTVHTTLTPADPAESPITQRKMYVQRSGVYVLDEVRTEVSLSTPGFSMTGEHVARFVDVRWAQNAARDAQRQAGAAGDTWGGSGSTPSLDPWQPPACDYTSGDPCPEYPADPGGGTSGGSTQTGCPSVTGGARLVFVHGINSDGIKWGFQSNRSGVRGRSYCGMQIDESQAPNLANRGFESHAAQTTQLRTIVRGMSDQQILIGHSQGGLISRRVAHRLTAQDGEGQRIRGVVTIGTPHQGALIARNAPSSVLSGVAQGVVRHAVCRVLPTCTSLQAGIEAAMQQYLAVGAGGGTTAMNNLRPGSGAMMAVNGQQETFPRFGIQHYVDQRWLFARVAGDTYSVNGGPSFVTALDVIAAAALAAGLIGILWPPAAAAAAILGTFLYVAVTTDRAWKHLTAGGEIRSDGIVAGSSQVYPNAILNREAETPTSHTGEMNTERSYREVERVLVQNLGVARSTP